MSIDHTEFDRGVSDAIGHLRAAPIPRWFVRMAKRLRRDKPAQGQWLWTLDSKGRTLTPDGWKKL